MSYNAWQVMNLDVLRPHVPTTSSKQQSRRHPEYDLPVAEPPPAPHTPSQSTRSPLFELQIQRISGGRCDLLTHTAPHASTEWYSLYI